MIWVINKLVGWFTNPLVIALLLLIAALFMLFHNRKAGSKKKKIVAHSILVFTAVWLWLWGTGAVTMLVGIPLEREFLADGKMKKAEEYPKCDAIVCLGGGIGAVRGILPYAELNGAADRPYFAAKLWKHGKAPVIITTSNRGHDLDVRFLVDLGVPKKCVTVEDKALTTEENAKYTSKLLGGTEKKRKKVLLVTSSWHMKRSLLQFSKYAPNLETVPAPCDFEATVSCNDMPFWKYLVPNSAAFALNCVFWHEWVGYWGYKFLR